MKAFGFTQGGGPTALQEFDIAAPHPANDQVLIDVAAIGLNNRERLSREQGSLGGPTIPGRDAAGIVTAVGSNHATFQIGDRVVAHVQQSYAAQVTASVRSTAKLPAQLSFTTAAALVTPGVTAYRIVYTFGRIRAGETVIVKGASGGVGSLVVQLANQVGATVIGVASARNQLLVEKLGVDRFVAYDQADISTALAATADIVVNVAMNGASGDQDVAMVKPGGRIISVSHHSPRLPAGITFQHAYPGDDTDSAALPQLVQEAAAGQLTVPIDHVFPFTLAGFVAAHEALDSQHTGRIVVAKELPTL
ncbi:NADP-dependent oxidoreductase [Schleiferilactobacillus harbinensis]|uniref:NADP-dependent oxidoreductase n=1 Tax=Schleiferilactobacillus harbinensis TaxID=304207 RepID=A0ABU7T3L6_9LACO